MGSTPNSGAAGHWELRDNRLETDQTVLEALEAGAWYTWGPFRKASEMGGARAWRGTACLWVSDREHVLWVLGWLPCELVVRVFTLSQP